ncbi:MAG: acetate kinase, partial [Candidatus Binatia bacterium]
MKVLVLNCGSSTLKFQVVESDGLAESRKLARGIVDRIGGPAAYSFKTD